MKGRPRRPRRASVRLLKLLGLASVGALASLPSTPSLAANASAPSHAANAKAPDVPRHHQALLPVQSAPGRSAAPRRPAAPAIPLPGAVGTNVDVSADTANRYSETAVAIDPKATTNMFAGSNITTAPGIGSWFSANSGTTWTSNPVVNVRSSDPTAQYDAHSNLFYSFITVDPSLNTSLAVFKNSSGTWSSTDFSDSSPGQEDRPSLAVDPNDITVPTTFTPFYDAFDNFPADPNSNPMWVRSETATTPTTVKVWDSGGELDPSLAIDGSHNVYMVWDDWCGLNATTIDNTPCMQNGGQILFSKSTDKGATWLTTPSQVTTTTTGFGAMLPNYGAPCISGFPQRPVGPTPSLAIDRSGGTHNGTLYMVYADGADAQIVARTVPSANRMHIKFRKSTNGGTSWSAPVPIDTGNLNNDSWQPALAVDQSNGNITIAWYDRRDDANNVLYRTYYTQSTDGGATFLSSQIPVAGAQSDPRVDPNGTGDYLWIDAAGGHARPAWTDTSVGNVPQVFTADINESGSFTVPTQTGVVNGSPLNPSGTAWRNLPGGARDIGVGADCIAWVVGTNPVPYGFGLYQWTNSSGFIGIDGGGVRISVNFGGAPRIINSINGIWRLLSTGWSQLPGSGTDIAAGALGDLFVIGTDRQPGGGGVYQLTASGFSFFNGSGVRIALDPNGEPWVINNTHQIWRHTNGTWVQLPGAANDIGVGANGQAWVIGTNPVPGGFGVYRWTGSNWAAADGGGVAISVGADGLPWIINNGGAIYQRLF